MERLLTVVVICVPVFALVGLGKLLQSRGVLSEHDQGKLSWLVYYLSLPALIFVNVARQPFTELMDLPIIVSTLSVTVLACALFYGVGMLLRLPAASRAMLAWSPFWANVSYLGFPLAERAYGAEGLAAASIVNAFTMPVFVIIGSLLLAFASDEGGSVRGHIRKAVLNPIIGAAIAGILVSLIGSSLPESAANWQWLTTSTAVLGGFLDLLGSMGLPLALICVGAALRATELRGKWPLILTASAAKLIITPALVLAMFALFFPEASDAARGVAVVLMATPMAVAAFVISRQQQVASELAAAHLVVSTGVSCFTIPMWLYLVY